MGKKIHIRIRDGDRARLERIRDEMGVSMSGAVRAAIVALSRQLGFEREIPPDLLEK
jgi:antitoxin component of RelBE/YafQ-DinJ toxin-antitoxin module